MHGERPLPHSNMGIHYLQYDRTRREHDRHESASNCYDALLERLHDYRYRPCQGWQDGRPCADRGGGARGPCDTTWSWRSHTRGGSRPPGPGPSGAGAPPAAAWMDPPLARGPGLFGARFRGILRPAAPCPWPRLPLHAQGTGATGAPASKLAPSVPAVRANRQERVARTSTCSRSSAASLWLGS
jgi:hypothetical protein